MQSEKYKVCPKCKFKCRRTYERIEEFFGYRSVSDKGQPVPQSYCRECRNDKEDKTPLKKLSIKSTPRQAKNELKEQYDQAKSELKFTDKPKKVRVSGRGTQIVNLKRKEVKEKMTIGEVVLKKEIEKLSDERKKNIKETYQQMFPQDKNRRGYDYMQARIERANGKSA